MQIVRRQHIAVAAGLRTVFREPTTLALLFVLPPLVILAFDVALGTMEAVPGVDLPPAAAELGGALFATAVLAGLLGVFQIVAATGADGRLAICGYSPWEVVLARTLTIVLAGTVVAVVTFTTVLLWGDVSPAAPLLALGALVLAGVLYGLLGVLIGTLVGRELAGSLVLVFLADFDAFASMGTIPVEHDVVDYLPLAGPYELLSSAVHDGTVPTGDLIVTLAYVLVLGLVVLAVVSTRGEIG